MGGGLKLGEGAEVLHGAGQNLDELRPAVLLRRSFRFAGERGVDLIASDLRTVGRELHRARGVDEQEHVLERWIRVDLRVGPPRDGHRPDSHERREPTTLARHQRLLLPSELHFPPKSGPITTKALPVSFPATPALVTTPLVTTHTVELP